MRGVVFLRSFAGKPRSYRNHTKPVGARLAREGVIPNTAPHPDFFEIRNDFALASTTRYITTVISSGSRK
ncbi:hypothetical protein PMI30_02419 [Pseudomonas sp. GM50]|nr:hypothetical protein PMI30_02419 [Pseudomonas sp. GM50]